MAVRFGPGPVFVHESIVATRRWQLYALRSLFVLGLLAALALAWLSVQSQYGKAGGNLPIRGLAAMGQFVLHRHRQRAARAGADHRSGCDGRHDLPGSRRGTLTHMLVTELTSAEIVLGKLAARLAPVVALVAATMPVLALAGLLGGVVIEAIVALTLMTLVLAIFGCTLALAISVRASKTHEVLMAVYGIEPSGCWALIWFILEETGLIRAVPDWLWAVNPFRSGVGPYSMAAGCQHAWELTVLLCGVLAFSAGLTAYARCSGCGPMSPAGPAQETNWFSAGLAGSTQRLAAWRPGPSLDDNPVLWREWRRGRPSRLARIVWGVFISASVAGTGWGLSHSR